MTGKLISYAHPFIILKKTALSPCSPEDGMISGAKNKNIHFSLGKWLLLFFLLCLACFFHPHLQEASPPVSPAALQSQILVLFVLYFELVHARHCLALHAVVLVHCVLHLPEAVEEEYAYAERQHLHCQ